jgi:hypothetical protein
MKVLKYYISIVFISIIALSSCEKHKLIYDAVVVDETKVMLQIHFFVPIATGSTNAINQVKVNDISVTFNNLNPYNGIPDGATGKFFTADAGNVNIKFYTGSIDSGYNQVYDGTVNLQGGKAYNVFIHNFNEAPVAIDNGYPYQMIYPGYHKDSICYERFYNFYYDSDGTPLCKNGDKLQLQFVYYQTTAAEAGWEVPYPLTDTFSIGEPVGFGEATEWTPIFLRKTYYNSEGYMPIRLFFRLIKADGTKTWVPYMSSATSGQVIYTVQQTHYIGRRYHKILGGKFGGNVFSNQIFAFQTWTAI